MNVLLTFDVEVWCDGWNNLDHRFPASFERYVFGRSSQGDFALPKTLDILDVHGVRGVFFVEPLFAARFGMQYLHTIVELIRSRGHEIQLHLHPEWVDEIDQPIVSHHGVKRPLLSEYKLEDQVALIAYGKRLLMEAGVDTITAFRAGSFAANRATFTALERNDIYLDSSLNSYYAMSGPDMRSDGEFLAPVQVGSVSSHPVTVFRDGFGRVRPAQLAGCGFSELKEVLCAAQKIGMEEVVIVSHNFELLKSSSSRPDRIVVRRFERFCSFLAERRITMPTVGFGSGLRATSGGTSSGLPTAGALATARRHAAQFIRRI